MATIEQDEAMVSDAIFRAFLDMGPVRPSKPSYMWSKYREQADVAARAAFESKGMVKRP